MLTDFLISHKWLMPMTLVLLIVFGPIIGMWLSSRPRLAWILVGFSLLPIALLTLVPVDRELFERCTIQWMLPTPNRVELFANVVLFVAPAMLVGVATRRPLVALAAGSGLAVILEAIQAAVPAIGRSCDTTDWLSNSIGAAIGAGLAISALYLKDRSTR